MITGLDVERDFVTALQQLGCETAYDTVKDKHKKIDITLLKVRGRKLREPSEIQITRRRDDFKKIDQYLKSETAKRPTSWFIEIGTNVSAEAAAIALLSAMSHVSKSRKKTKGARALRALDGGRYEFFDLQARWGKLLLIENGARLRGRFEHIATTGVVISSGKEVFWAYDTAMNDRLRSRVRDHRAGGEKADGLEVTFVDAKRGKPHRLAINIEPYVEPNRAIPAPEPAAPSTVPTGLERFKRRYGRK